MDYKQCAFIIAIIYSFSFYDYLNFHIFSHFLYCAVLYCCCVCACIFIFGLVKYTHTHAHNSPFYFFLAFQRILHKFVNYARSWFRAERTLPSIWCTRIHTIIMGCRFVVVVSVLWFMFCVGIRYGLLFSFNSLWYLLHFSYFSLLSFCCCSTS